MTSPSASGQVDIAASPEAVYALITDLATLAELAEETASMRWRRGSAAVPGAQFRGTNRNGWRRWSTVCTVTDAEPGARFAFDVRFPPGIPVSRWQYDIAPSESGCRVTESTWDRRPAWFRGPAGLATGVPERTVANTEHIQATLLRLKQRAESASLSQSS